MAEINKLSVGKVLDKLRKPDSPAEGLGKMDEKIEQAREEMRRLRAARKSFATGKPPLDQK
jgi:hypothetical protein